MSHLPDAYGYYATGAVASTSLPANTWTNPTTTGVTPTLVGGITFNASNGVFTVPVTGLYSVALRAQALSNAATSLFGLGWGIVGSLQGQLLDASLPASQDMFVNAAFLVRLSAGGTICAFQRSSVARTTWYNDLRIALVGRG